MKILIFDAIWCPSCLVMKSVWADVENENPWLRVEYFDFDKNKEAVNKHKIDKKLPVFILFDNNENEISRLLGEKSKKEILKAITENKEK